MRAMLCAVCLSLAPAAAFAEAPLPRPLEGVDVTEHLGQAIPRSLAFQDMAGNPVHFERALDGKKPLLLVIAYYRCPMLCGLVLKSVAESLADLGWKPGDQFRVVTISFDPSEGPHDAEQRRTATLSSAKLDLGPQDWPFWTGSKESVDALLDVLGVHLLRDPETNQFAHPAVFFAITPDGRISRYLYGVAVPPSNIKLALLEASDGKTGSAFDRVLLRCFMYDPATRRYGLFVGRFLKGGAAIILFFLSGTLVYLFRRDGRRA
jgi:protein SCO1/2